ncbi:MAG: site-specific integrase [Geodermatophilaceae bacterium]|nr:site-specific integrase [Geodermatophilaceae bacterium]
MRGSVVKRGKSWSVVVDTGNDPLTGRRRQRWHGGHRTKRDAEAALAEIVGSVNKGAYVPKSRQTLAEFTADWLAAIEPTLRPATSYSYARNLRLHVLPYLGATPLAGIDAGALNGLYAALLAEGRKDSEGGGLSPRSVRYVHTIAHRLFKDAVRWGRLARNPADAADPPRGTSSGSPDMVTWTAGELARFLDGARTTDRYWAAYLLLATTGMRRGEALGLRWADLDLTACRATIRQTVVTVNHEVQFGTPKTAKGRRSVSLDAVTVAGLREHRKAQAAERLLIGAGWRDHDLVFAKVDGTPLHPERFSREFTRRSARLGLPPIRLHDLRHGWATMALAAGVHPKVVQERLGHASISITLDTYSHVSPALHGEAAETVAALVFGTVR